MPLGVVLLHPATQMEALKILPQAFFDFIARIVPGLVALLLLSWIEPETWDAVTVALGRFAGNPCARIPLWLLLGAAYVAGHLLSPATKLVQRVTERYPRIEIEIEKGKEKEKDGPKKRIWYRTNSKIEAKEFKTDSVKYDWLRVHSPAVGDISAKLRAEFTLYNSLSAIFFLFAVWTVMHRQILCAGVLFVFGLLMAARGRETEDTMRKCVDNFEAAAKAPPKASQKP